MAARDDDGRWHIDKTVPIAMLLGLFIQAAGAFWWAAMTSARVEQLERQMAAAAPQAERLIRLEEKVSAIQGGIEEIKRALAQQPQAPAIVVPRR